MPHIARPAGMLFTRNMTGIRNSKKPKNKIK